jgi:hypothetical protein
MCASPCYKVGCAHYETVLHNALYVPFKFVSLLLHRHTKKSNMDDWQLATLCIMVVVFVILVAVIVGVFYVKVLRMRRSADPNLFYFYDFHRRLRVMDLEKYEARTGGAEGHAVDMHVPENFTKALAALVGDGDPDTVAVSRVDRGNVMVEIELRHFLHPDVRNASMLSTAHTPCCLSRHFTYIEAPMPMPGTAMIEMGPVSRQPSVRRTTRYLPTLPMPIILPVDPCLTTSTMVTVALAHYEYMDTNEELAPADAERIEAAMQRGLGGMIALSGGATAQINAGSQSAQVYPSRGSLRAESGPRSCQRIDFGKTNGCRLSFNYDGDEQDYNGAFTLPAGRQSICVTARAPNYATRSSSKVYTVEA